MRLPIRPGHALPSLIAAIISTPCLSQGAAPTPVQPGATVDFLSLANPSASAEKISVYAIYYLTDPWDPSYKPIRVKQLLLGDELTPLSQILESTSIQEAEVVALGVSQAEIDEIRDQASGTIRYTKYRHHIDLSQPPISAEYRSSASAAFTVMPVLNVDRAIVTIEDILGYKRYYSVPVQSGNPSTVTINGMEAGVATFTLQLYASGSMIAEGSQKFTLRKDVQKSISLPEQNSSSSYPLAQVQRLLITQGSQNDEGTAVVIAGRKAKFMALLWDPQSRVWSAQGTIRVTLPNGTSQVVPLAGAVGFSPVDAPLTADIPAELVQPGATFSMEVRLPDGTMLSRSYSPNIQPGRRITLHVYEVSPGPGFSGVPVARDASGMREQIVKWVEAQLPVAGFDIDIRPGLYFPASIPPYPYPWSDPGFSVVDLGLIAGLMDTFAAAEGRPRTDGHIYLAMINGRYAQAGGTVGFTAGKGFPGIAMFMYSQEYAQYTLAHELGHAHWLGHSPSPGASADPNPLDWEYPYGGDSVIAFAPWHSINGTMLPTTDKDLMSYSWWWPQWISDFNWTRFYDRTWEQGYGFASRTSSTSLLPKVKPGTTLTIGVKEAQSLADYLDSTQPTACGGFPTADLEAMKAELRRMGVSPIPHGKPPVLVNVVRKPKHEIQSHAVAPHVPSELEQLLFLPTPPKAHRR